MVINVYNIGTIMSVTEKLTDITVKDWRYRRSEGDIRPCKVLEIRGENAYVNWLTMTGTTQAEISFGAAAHIINLDDESTLIVSRGGRVTDCVKAHQRSTVIIEKDSRVKVVILDDDATLIIEREATLPEVRGNGKVINKN